ncbi:Isy1-like splicing factor [Suillus clintonianus]|uniref:Isy1-like splicing factor n=1 Tax=Suillus clintonianus TaxID=1904413 RepID=UPI001B882917|nr:Isy1-like splicing factor [Suillus clintonianus]KAG2118304.1 Isy1-like splicing factor [Suillus clintonianus]
MARNEEKAQSMLYRFREAQAAELGLGTRADRRPKMASGCKSLRECERWRGEILRELSRKVSKIQDAGLTDYEVRDVNDEINKLMREKRHWENQIIALGGANYRRNVAMLDDDGKEVPGTKGYKYFGRAKDLPGVKELFQSKKQEEEEENQALAFYKKFMNQGPAYFGDLDEADGKLLEYERQAEEAEWRDEYTNVREILDLPLDDPIPKIPRGSSASSSPLLTNGSSLPQPPPNAKRKAQEEDVEMDTVNADAAVPDQAKRPRKADADGSTKADVIPSSGVADSMRTHASAAAAYLGFLSAEDLMPPTLPTREEMEGVLLALRKQALVEEYFGE